MFIIVKTKRYKIKRFILFGITIFEKIKISRHNKVTKYFYFLPKYKPKKNQRIFYLKVHKVHMTSYECIKQWVDIANKMNAFIYFVCDNPEMKSGIFTNVIFKKRNFDFIKSDRKTLKEYFKKVLIAETKKWERVGFSILTPFTHASKYKHDITYNIDADDIMILNNTEQTAQALYKAEKYALDNNYDVINFDLYVSKTFGVHWTFGIVICLNPDNCIEAIKNNCQSEKYYKDYYLNKIGYNIDWFFSFLRDENILKIGTFYIENAMAVHMPDIMLRPSWAILMQFKNGYIHYPILETIYKETAFNKKKIIPSAIKISADINEDSFVDYLHKLYFWKYDMEFDCLSALKYRGLINDNYINDIISAGGGEFTIFLFKIFNKGKSKANTNTKKINCFGKNIICYQ